MKKLAVSLMITVVGIALFGCGGGGGGGGGGNPVATTPSQVSIKMLSLQIADLTASLSYNLTPDMVDADGRYVATLTKLNQGTARWVIEDIYDSIKTDSKVRTVGRRISGGSNSWDRTGTLTQADPPIQIVSYDQTTKQKVVTRSGIIAEDYDPTTTVTETEEVYFVAPDSTQYLVYKIKITLKAP